MSFLLKAYGNFTKRHSTCIADTGHAWSRVTWLIRANSVGTKYCQLSTVFGKVLVLNSSLF